MVKNMADVNNIAPWSDDSLCSMTGTQPPVTERDIMSTKLKEYIVKGFPGTKTELQTDVQPYWRVKDMWSEYNGVVYIGNRVFCLRSSGPAP